MRLHLCPVTAALVILGWLSGLSPAVAWAEDADDALRQQAADALQRAVSFYHDRVAYRGGYVYYYSPDLQQRWGEGPATETQIWVQPPGTPTVGLAYLEAYRATGDARYLRAATDAAEALLYGQLRSGGWTNCIDFDPQGRVAQYRNGKGGGKNVSSLDDGQSASAMRLLVAVDQAHNFRHQSLHAASQAALDALLAAQFPNGAFPQGWTGPTPPQPVMPARYPEYDWRTEGRIKNYWDMYTLNDNVPGYIADLLIDAYNAYGDQRYLTALRRLGDFLLLAQMPDPQPGWAQQYSYDMYPIWARKFEPPGISGDESQEAMETLMVIYRQTGDRRYLQPIPRAIAYLRRSLLPDDRLARYYELQTNKPLYMVRRGDVYQLTYDDSRLPDHYGWKTDSRLDAIQRQHARLQRQPSGSAESSAALRGGAESAAFGNELRQQVRRIIDDLDAEGRWIRHYDGSLMVGQPEWKPGTPYISSAVFSENVSTLSRYLAASGQDRSRAPAR